MNILKSLFLSGLILLLFAVSTVMADDTPFAHRQSERDAVRYESYLQKNWKPGDMSASTLINKARAVPLDDPSKAARFFALATVAEKDNAPAWLGLARALLKIDPASTKGSERYDLPVNAGGAAYLAYQRSTSPELKAQALAVLSQALQRRSIWRPALESLKASLALKEDPATRAIYEKVRAEHGFRMTNYTTESQSSSPRVCLQFSESLSRAPIDFANFVTVDGNDPQSVNVEGHQLCIDGLGHGRRFEIQVRQGLPSSVDENLEKNIELAVYVPDRDPVARFTGRAYVLPSHGQQGIPIVTVNTNRVKVEVYRIGDRGLVNALNNGDLNRQLSSWNIDDIKNRSGAQVYKGVMDVTSKLNKEVTTAFPITEAIGTLKPGAYLMVARADSLKQNRNHNVATQWFIVSDLGLTALKGEDGVHGFVRSLANAKAIEGASVKLVARNNEILATSTTDERGYIHFNAALTRGEGGLQPAVLVAQNGPTDYAFLDLAGGAFDLSDRGVEGRAAPGPIDGLLYAERGIYRPGEDIHLTALVRESTGLASAIPATLIVTRPDGVEHRRITLTDEGMGGRTATVMLDHGAMTGTWRARLHIDPKENAISQTAFLVEDFVPERLDMTLTKPTGALFPGKSAMLKVEGRYLYGPPAADLALEGEIIVKPASAGIPGFTGYSFGLHNEQISSVRKVLQDLPTTASDGVAQIALELPRMRKTARPLEARVLIKLRETGGRTIERRTTLPVDLGMARIGIKPQFDATGLGEGEEAKFDIIMLGPDSTAIDARGLTWTLKRVHTNWQWYSRNGNWSYEPITITRKIKEGTIDVSKNTPASLSLPVDYGRYVLEIISKDDMSIETTFAFSAGWYASGDSPDSPEMLDVALDKKSYNPGDKAKLRIDSKSGGRALITVLANGLKLIKEVEIPRGGGDVQLTVADDWGSGAYVTATLYRAMDTVAKRMPQRAIGIAWLKLDQTARTLNIALNTAKKIGSGETLEIPIQVSGMKPGSDVFVTVAAVDLGILNLTGYKTPNPEAHFYAQTRLGMEIRDAYGRLIDGMSAQRGRLRSGGDAAGALSAQGSPPVEATIAEFSGIVKLAEDGTTRVSFDIPEFNGTVRIMAVAWSKEKLGHAQSNIIVRDPIALTASVPRFLTLGDEAQVALDLHNVEGQSASYSLSIKQQVGEEQESDLMDRTIKLTKGERRSETLTLKPKTVGLHNYFVRVTGPGSIDVARTLTIDVKPPATDIKRTTISTLRPGGKLSVSKDLTTGLIQKRTTVNLSIGPTARFNVPALLTQLDRYPYGCAEQTVSRALPLVYVNQLATQVGLATDKEIKTRVQAAIDRVFNMQNSSGAFGSWGPSNSNIWLTSYVTDFLTRAKENGYSVNAQKFTQALDRLANFISYARDFESGGEKRAYALYVLARNGRAPAGELRYYVDTRLSRFTTPLAKAQLGAALAMIGDKPRSQSAFGAAVASMTAQSKPNVHLSRSDYGSILRDGAALIALSLETGQTQSKAASLIEVVTKAYGQRMNYTSTQEQAWMLLAAHALSKASKDTSLTVDGAPHSGPLQKRINAVNLLTKSLVIENTDQEPVDTVISVVGDALTPEPAIAKGFKIERNYYTLEGKPVEMGSATGGETTIKQNDRFVVVLSLTTEHDGGRVLLVDRLPAGLEIENPRIVESGDIKSLPWLKSQVRPEHTQFRDDRFVAAFDLFKGNNNKLQPAGTSTKVAYIVRAVTLGSFVHPAATVEDMYHTQRHARTPAGRLIISQAR